MPEDSYPVVHYTQQSAIVQRPALPGQRSSEADSRVPEDAGFSQGIILD